MEKKTNCVCHIGTISGKIEKIALGNRLIKLYAKTLTYVYLWRDGGTEEDGSEIMYKIKLDVFQALCEQTDLLERKKGKQFKA